MTPSQKINVRLISAEDRTKLSEERMELQHGSTVGDLAGQIRAKSIRIWNMGWGTEGNEDLDMGEILRRGGEYFAFFKD
ncbi:hypothetical protein KAR91_35745 [Candidatus Pacearchaeota archaeon]|nr:hypothetical protein [Candidatus Pacearchaeota archaeon]